MGRFDDRLKIPFVMGGTAMSSNRRKDHDVQTHSFLRHFLLQLNIDYPLLKM